MRPHGQVVKTSPFQGGIGSSILPGDAIFLGENMLKRLSDFKYLIEQESGMNVPGIIYANEKILKDTGEEPLNQVKNVASLPGIQKYSLAMPDIHWGYGFPIGGVAAFDNEDGIISPGGVGYDINCGVRMISTNIIYDDIRDKIDDIAVALFKAVPSGVGSSGEIILKKNEVKKVLERGAEWPLENGIGWPEDLDRTEDRGQLKFHGGADEISERAYERGQDQLGTLGAGNHFLEVQKVDKIFMPEIAQKFGIYRDSVVIMFHTGSRGLGYQVCDDYLHEFRNAVNKYSIAIKDPQLVCAPLKSSEGRGYFNAMSGAANFAWANREVITDKIRGAFEQVFKSTARKLGMKLIYDVSHNIAKMEEHEIDGNIKLLCVHRKGATRALPQGHKMLGKDIKETGQPVLVPGDMGRASFILIGDKEAKDTFYSCAHGAGRLLSRHAALKQGKGRDILDELSKQGITVKVRSKKLLSEEAPFAYKDVEDITNIVEAAGLARRVARLKPLAVVKG